MLFAVQTVSPVSELDAQELVGLRVAYASPELAEDLSGGHGTAADAIQPQARRPLIKTPEFGAANGLRVRFAVPRCWSGGDSNRRSSLWFLALTKGSKFQPGHCAEADQRIGFPSDLAANSGQKNGRTSFPFPMGKRPKRTGGSNLLRSTNEALRTAGSVR